MNSLFDPAVQLQITCHTPDEFQEKALGWDIDHLQVASGNYRISMDLNHTKSIQLSNVTHHIGIHERGAIPQGTYAVSLPSVMGAAPLYCCGGRVEKDEFPALLPGEEFETHSSGAINYISIIADANLLDREAVLLTGQPFSSLLRSQRVCIGKQDQLRLVQTISTLMQELKNFPHHLPTRQQELLEKQLVEQLLLSIRSLSGERIKIPNRKLVARKAEQLIRQHPRQRLNIEQLCSLIGCSARTLHLGFKERYDTTPKQYARTLALNAVCRELRNLSPSGTISDVAMAWGFYHLGRFSQQYQQLFDELPSVTVERNRKPTA
ncbi:MAG: helix-turn-helix transcriptional regulator [Deltaproteobacteria bacterium]|nr:helix-turn-helix transcriptional regulator [Deltaproteobacteria bacterium]